MSTLSGEQMIVRDRCLKAFVQLIELESTSWPTEEGKKAFRALGESVKRGARNIFES